MVLIQLLSFGVGLYSGHNFWPTTVVDSTNITNYNTNALSENTTVKETQTTENSSVDCKIKGNISSSNKIYHLQGGSFYERTTAEMCFNTEEEAIAAGFVKSSR